MQLKECPTNEEEKIGLDLLTATTGQICFLFSLSSVLLITIIVWECFLYVFTYIENIDKSSFTISLIILIVLKFSNYCNKSAKILSDFCSKYRLVRLKFDAVFV